MCCSAAKQERALLPRKPSSQERDKDQMGKWHCQDTQSREEEESIAGGSKARNVLADVKHEPVLVDPTHPDLLMQSSGTKATDFSRLRIPINYKWHSKKDVL